MVLVNSDYSLLLGNVFCIPTQTTAEIDAQLISLIHKIFELPVLQGIVENYLEYACCNTNLLCAMRERLQLLLELPQRRLPHESEFPREELLLKIEPALSECCLDYIQIICDMGVISPFLKRLRHNA